MTTLKRHQLKRLQRLAVQVSGLIKEAEYKEEYKRASELHNVQFQLRQLAYKFGL